MITKVNVLTTKKATTISMCAYRVSVDDIGTLELSALQGLTLCLYIYIDIQICIGLQQDKSTRV